MKMFAPAQKMRSFRLRDDDRVHLGVLEAEALDRVGELDVDAEVVGVQLEPVVRRQAGVFLHVHRQRRNGPSNVSFQWSVAVGRGLEHHRDLGGLFHPGLFMLVLAGVNAAAS